MRRLIDSAARALLAPAFVRYLAVGGLSYLADVGLLVALREGLGAPLWVATSLAFLVIGVGVNFTLNATWVFTAGPDRGRQVVRYLALVACNYLLTLVLVVGLTGLGLGYVLAKTVAVAVCVLLNFLAYRTWVFRDPDERPVREPVPPV